jgi:nitroreductase
MKNIIKFLQIRRSITAKNMIDNNINEDDLEAILDCGIRVPDHGALNPWKLIVIKNNARFRIGNDILAKEFKINNPAATEEKDFVELML